MPSTGGKIMPAPPPEAPPAGAATAPRPAASAVPVPGRIPEIDGLRGVAIALIVVYHLWFRRVSGGVDVFLLLSGFLITWTLVRTVEKHGRVRFIGFYARVVRRIVPPALVVLIGVVVATVVWLPQTRWRETLADVVASALYTVNWHLASNAVDYLASQNAASPVQHYWSLAIQGQFYLTWPLLIAAAALLAGRSAVRLRTTLGLLLGAVFVVSLGYSVHRTAVDQVYTYFDTFARLWEFALGGLLVLALPYLRLPRAVAVPLGWLGLVALASCGMVFRGGNEFPGWAALWPTLAGCLLLATAGTGSRVGVDRLLRSRPLSRLGELSFALYLWHWPVLICYLAVTGYATPTLRGGLLIIAASVVLSVATRWLVEIRLPRSGLGQRTSSGGFALAATCVAAVLVITAGWHGYMSWQQRPAGDPASYPGAAYLATGGPLPDVPYRPAAWDAKDDRAVVYDQGCHQRQHDSEVIACEFGPAGAGRTIALVGGSHSAHWLPALLARAEQHGWRVVSMTKSSCRFKPADLSGGGNRTQVSCQEWNENVIARLAELRPDAVFTTSTVAQGGRESTPEGYLTQWRRLEELGITVLAIRDTPWHDVDVPECVETHGRDARRCGGDRSSHGLAGPAAVAGRPDVPGNVRFLDLTDYVCDGDACPAVIGNVLVYHDAHHLSATYARTLGPFLADEILAATGW
jgi:peptidoglycan/LPS O-acetylase OafA/YrhL